MAVKCINENRFHSTAYKRRVFFTRDVNQAGEKSPECVAPYKEADALAVLNIQNSQGCTREIGHGALE